MSSQVAPNSRCTRTRWRQEMFQVVYQKLTRSEFRWFGVQFARSNDADCWKGSCFCSRTFFQESIRQNDDAARLCAKMKHQRTSCGFWIRLRLKTVNSSRPPSINASSFSNRLISQNALWLGGKSLYMAWVANLALAVPNYRRRRCQVYVKKMRSLGKIGS